MFPTPIAGNPIFGLEFDQPIVALAGVDTNAGTFTDCPTQTKMFAIGSATGMGFTVIVALEFNVAEQLAGAGV